MALEQIKAEIALLLSGLAEGSRDRHELEFKLHAKLAELRAFGLPLPEDLAALETALDQALTREAREASSRRHCSAHGNDDQA